MKHYSPTRPVANRLAMDPNWPTSSGQRAVEENCRQPMLHLGAKDLILCIMQSILTTVSTEMQTFTTYHYQILIVNATNPVHITRMWLYIVSLISIINHSPSIKSHTKKFKQCLNILLNIVKMQNVGKEIWTLALCIKKNWLGRLQKFF